MTWILTHSRQRFDLASDSLRFEIDDIAHALAHVPRFCGHTPRPYSVAQHSVSVFHHLTDHSPEIQVGALLHDLSEAYLCDVPKPFKAMLPDYDKMQDRVMREAAEQFGFEWPVDHAIKCVDHAVLVAEMEFLFGKGMGRFAGDGPQGWEEYGEATITRRYWPPKYAKDAFLSIYFSLTR